MKRLFAMILALCLMLSLCACTSGGGSTEPTGNTVNTTEGTEPVVTTEATEPADERITYTVTVQDEGGNPIASAMVQMCQGENCMPAVTEANGVATFKVDEEADFEVKFIALPAGYDYATEEQVFYFADGSYDLTITLKAVA